MNQYAFKTEDLVDHGIPYSSIREWSVNLRKPRINSRGELARIIALLTPLDVKEIRREIEELYE